MPSKIRTNIKNNWGKYIVIGLGATAVSWGSYTLYKRVSEPESRKPVTGEPIVSTWWGCYLDDAPESIRTGTDPDFPGKNYNTGVWFVGNDGKPRTLDDELRYVLQDENGIYTEKPIRVDRKYFRLDNTVSKDPRATYMKDGKATPTTEATTPEKLSREDVVAIVNQYLSERLPSEEGTHKEEVSKDLLNLVIDKKIAEMQMELFSGNVPAERLNEMNSQLSELETLKSKIERLERSKS